MNGPNLNLLGTRDPEIYGRTTLKEVEARCREIAREAGCDLVAFQSNHEGALIDFLQQHRDARGAIINPGGLAHTSVVLRDAVADSDRGDRGAVHRQRRGGIRAGPTLAHRGDEENVISAGEIKRGMTIELDGVLYQIVEFQHIKLGRGSAQMRMKLRNVRKGDLVEKTFQANDRYQRARLDHRNVQFMYKDGTHYHFMDTATYDQIALDDDQLGDATNYLTDGMTVILSEYEGSPIGVEMPASVVLTVTDTDLGLKGDTATGATKPATLETGIRVNVPLFVERGDKIKVDTRTGEYLERA
jgi:elongation factor P